MKEIKRIDDNTVEGDRMKISGKILMCGHVMVDQTMLDFGIYATAKPHIYYNIELTIESLTKVYEASILVNEDNKLVLQNLKKCRLVDIEIHIKEAIG